MFKTRFAPLFVSSSEMERGRDSRPGVSMATLAGTWWSQYLSLCLCMAVPVSVCVRVYMLVPCYFAMWCIFGDSNAAGGAFPVGQT